MEDVNTRQRLACVARVSVRFRSKERGTKVKDRAKNDANKRAGRSCRRFIPFPPPFPLPPSLLFHFLALVLFLGRPKPKIPFPGLFLLRNQTDTLATQARQRLSFSSPELRYSVLEFNSRRNCQHLTNWEIP